MKAIALEESNIFFLFFARLRTYRLNNSGLVIILRHANHRLPATLDEVHLSIKTTLESLELPKVRRRKELSRQESHANKKEDEMEKRNKNPIWVTFCFTNWDVVIIAHLSFSPFCEELFYAQTFHLMNL